MKFFEKDRLLPSAMFYLCNLAVFIALPGFHLVASGRKKLGWLILWSATIGSLGGLILSQGPDRNLFILMAYLSLLLMLSAIIP